MGTKDTDTFYWKTLNDGLGQPIEERYFNSDGQPALTPDAGFHLRKKEYDIFGNQLSEAYFDVHGEPMLDGIEGIHRRVMAYGNGSSPDPDFVRFFDTTGQPMDNKLGFHEYHSNVERHRSENDESGLSVVETYWCNQSGRLVSGPEGFHLRNSTYIRVVGKMSRLLSRAYYGEDNRPVRGPGGYHAKHCSYDEAGRQLTAAYFDEEGRPVQGREGYQRESSTYDQQGNRLSSAFYDENNCPIVNNKGIHEIIYNYYAKGKVSKCQNFSLHGKPAEDECGNHLELSEYDEYGRKTAITQLRADGSPNLNRELQIATLRQAYDSNGEVIEQTYFDAGNQRIVVPVSVGKIRLNRSIGRFEMIYNGTEWKLAGNFDARHGREIYAIQVFPTSSIYNEVLSQAEKPKRHKQLQVLVVSEVEQPGLKAGVAPGDLLWQCGNWSFPEAMSTALANKANRNDRWASLLPPLFSDDPDISAICEGFRSELNRLNMQSYSITMIRNGEPIHLTVQPLPERKLGVHIQDRFIPITVFDAWKSREPEKK